MLRKPKPNEIINGTYGKVYINGNKFANIKTFEAKLVMQYEEVDIAEDPGKQQRYMGYSGEGTMTLHKVDSGILKLVSEDIKAGKMPEIMMVGAVSDPSALGTERIQFDGVTLDEIMLLKFEQKTLTEEEVPFKFADFTPLELI